MCYPAEFGRSRSDGTSVIKEIRLKRLTHRVPPFKVTQCPRNRHGLIRHLWLHINVPNNHMVLSGTVSEINDDFSRKSQILSHPGCIWRPRWRGSPWNWVLAQGSKTRMMVYWVEKEVWRYLQQSGYNTWTWRTDGQADGRRTDTGRQQRPRLRIASRAW